MVELVQASFAPANVLATGLLIFVMLYWVIVIVGLLDMSSLDVEVETDIDGEGIGAVAWLNSALAFFNLGRIPLMFFLSFFALPFWFLSLGVNELLGTHDSWLGFTFILPLAVVCLFVAKLLTWPFVKLFSVMEKEQAPKTTVIGQVCTIMLPANATQIGQAAVQTNGSPLLLNVKTTQGHLVKKGETALVIDYLPENQLYLIEPYESL
ncbi:hypothetical protein [Rufibacter quisquiliarum]|uniref:DUF1449 domain-containing protein n=1 Tax=Rufibacter quisquiliarum TaxID=1549639 RepID=A0A839GHP6_9BACT|nr:hypothetical protein [Rufibacter quisquiliarum]MBA9079174.1 hypothetical protein [Rufibacter quisquiliarum]